MVMEVVMEVEVNLLAKGTNPLAKVEVCTPRLPRSVYTGAAAKNRADLLHLRKGGRHERHSAAPISIRRH